MDFLDYQEGQLSPFGLALLQLSELEYDSLEDAADDISQTLGCEYEDVDDLIRGYIAPEPEIVSALADLFDSTENEDIYNQFVETAIDTYELMEAAEDEYDDYDEYDEEYDDVDYYYDDEDEYDYDAYYDDEYYDDDVEDDYALALEEAQYKAALANERIAEFERHNFMQNQHIQLRNEAYSMMEEGVLPPVAFSRLFGDDPSDSFANFSKATDYLGMDEEAHLACIEYSLNLFRELGPIMNFSQVVEDPIQSSLNESDEEDTDYVIQGALSALGYGLK